MRVRRGHSLGGDEVRRRVDRLAEDLKERFSLRTAWQGDDLAVSGSGVNGHIRVREHEVEVDVSLGLGLKLMEGSIRAAVEAAMDEHLA